MTPTAGTEATGHSADALLRRCADAAPAPWFPRSYAKSAGVSLDDLLPALEYLWQEGLVRKALAPGEPLPGLALSDSGARALHDPDLLDRVRRGRPVARRDRTAGARRAASGAGRPLVNRALVLLNLLAFAYGAWLAWQARPRVVEAYLSGVPKAGETADYLRLLARAGSVTAENVVRGEGWRLLTAAFAHGGLLHLLMNVGMLAAVGRYAEAMWGRGRYLLVYATAALGGNCLAVARGVHLAQVEVPGGVKEIVLTPLVLGASGAVCGVLAAVAVWLAFNGRYLSRPQVREWRGNLLASAAVIGVVSLFPGVSGWSHLGGALAGGVTALLLEFQRWGPSPWRWLGLAGVAAVPVLSLAAVDHVRATDPRWHAVELKVYAERFGPRAVSTRRDALLLAKQAAELLAAPPRKRDRELTRQLLPRLEEKRREVEALAEDLARAGPLHGQAEEARAQDHDKVARLAEELATRERGLRENASTPEQDDREEREFDRQFRNRTQQEARRALDYYQAAARPLLARPAADRDVSALIQSFRGAEPHRRKLAALKQELNEAGPYGNEVVEQARKAGARYAETAAALLDAAEKALRTDGDLAAVKEPEERVVAAEAAWEKVRDH